MNLKLGTALIAVVAVTGCGSTVAGSGSASAGLMPGGGQAEQGLNGPASGPAVGPASGGNASAGSGGAAMTVGTASASGSGARAATGGAAALGNAAGNGPGVTATTIVLGVSYYQSAAAANAALGARGVDTGDPVAATRALIAAINKSGGIAGRHVTPLFYAIDPQSSTPYATEAQAECTYFTQDHKIFALIDGAPAADTRVCMARAGVAVLRGGILTSALTPNEVDAYTSVIGRVFAALVPSLSRQGWFGGWNRVTGSPGTTKAKVGIVTVDDIDDNRAVDHVLIPALARLGYAPDPGDVIRITPPGGFSDDGATAAAIDNAALKLNADGVDHVILTDGNGSLSLLFNNYAYSQNYFPRYGGTSGNAWQVLLSAGDLQAKTLRGAMGIGWQPLFDVPHDTQGDGPYANAARRHCFAVFKAAGMPATDAATAGGQAEGCDIAFLLPTALSGYTGPLNLNTLQQRVASLGSTYPLASGFASRFAPDQRDGNGAFLPMHFDDSSGTILYSSGSLEAMPGTY